MHSPLVLRTFRGSLFGSPGRRETMKIAIFCRRGHKIHLKNKKMKKKLPLGRPISDPDPNVLLPFQHIASKNELARGTSSLGQGP